jgi:PAS domain S-box-containing protein
MEATPIASPAVRAERDRYVAFAFAAADLLLEIDRQGLILFASGAAQQLTGRADQALIGASLYDLLAPEDRGSVAAEMGVAHAALTAHGGRVVPFQVRLGSAQGPVAVLGICCLPERNGSLFLTLSLTVPSVWPAGPASAPADGSGKAAVDPRTGLMAREDFANFATRRMGAKPDAGYKLTFVALDGLGVLRQRVSREVGEGLDAAIGRRLRAGGGDVEVAAMVSEGRYGVLHQSPIDETQLRKTLESLTQAADPQGVGVSMRAATMALDPGALSEADAARALVYSVQRFANLSDGGAFDIETLHQGVKALLGDTVARVGSLRSAVDQRTFRLEYQPVVALNLGASQPPVHHCEALSRFADGESVFGTVAFAEAVGMVSDLDYAVCERVIALLRQTEDKRLAVAVNISGRSLESAIFATSLLELLAGHAALSKKLLFEITESAAITRFEDVNNFLQVLRGRGFRLCLDDFGAGTNSFHYLRRFSVDFVKLDGQFVRQAGDSAQDLSCLKAIAKLSRELGAATIAEMIETEEQLKMLTSIGVEFGQGYLLGRPSPTPAACDFIPSKRKRRAAVVR